MRISLALAALLPPMRGATPSLPDPCCGDVRSVQRKVGVWRRPIFYVPLLIILVLAAIELAGLGAMRLVYPGGYPDPFAPYAAIMPGQPSAVLSHYPCHFEKQLERSFEPILCRIRPKDGVFSEVVAHFQNDRIWQVEFKPEGLRVGDLVLHWGIPDLGQDDGGLIYIRWHGGTVYAVVSPDSQKRQYNYLLPVYSIILTQDEP